MSGADEPGQQYTVEYGCMVAKDGGDYVLYSDYAALEADAIRYRKIRGINKFVGMLEFAIAHVGSDEEYDVAIDNLPVRS